MLDTRNMMVGLVLAVATLNSLAPARAATPETKRLRILLVIDTNARGLSCPPVDEQNMVRMIRQLRAGREDRITLHTYEGNHATPGNILWYYRTYLKDVRPTDALLFYYTGHGGWDAAEGRANDEKGHYLALSAGTLYRSKLRQAMLTRDPGAVYILTDCCSSLTQSESPRAGTPAPGQAGLRPQWQTFRDLFFLHHGLVDIQAASRGQSGWSSDGSFFTSALTELVCRPRAYFREDGRDGFVTWKAFFHELRAETRKQFRQCQRACAAGSQIRQAATQTPQALYLVEWPMRQRYLKIVNRTGQRLRVRLWCQTYNGREGRWQWYGGDDGYLIVVPAVKTVYARVDDWWVWAHAIKFRAATTSDTWTYVNKPWYLTPAGGYALSSETNVYRLYFS
jgi:hypothetical protein